VDGAGVQKAGSVLGYFGWLSRGLSLGTALASLRETSVVFATLIAVCLFGEGWGARRIVAAVAVVAGLAILHVG
jgi:uncharacterized membrane protein